MSATPRSPRIEFSENDSDYLVRYLAKYTPDGRDRSGNQIWRVLVDNGKKKWPWSRRHTWQSWRNHYVKNREYYDRQITKWQKKHPEEGLSASDLAPAPTPRSTPGRSRVPYSREDDRNLVAYLAEHSLSSTGRLGNSLYTRLTANDGGNWPWASRHPALSWRERYKIRREEFDEYIEHYQQTHSHGAILETPARERKSARRKAAAARDEVIKEEEEEEEEEKEGKEEERERDQSREQGEQEYENDQQKRPRKRKRLDETDKGKGKEMGERGDDQPERAVTRRQTKKRRIEHSSDEDPQVEHPLKVEAAEEQHEAVKSVQEPAETSGADADVEDAEHVEEELDTRDSEDTETGVQHREPPASDDRGDVLTGHEKHEGIANEEIMQVSPVDARQNEEEEGTIDINEGLPMTSTSQSASTSDNKAIPSSTLEPDDTPRFKIYPDIPSSPLEADKLSLPGTFPTTSTPHTQQRPRNDSVISQVIPSPETLLKLERKMKPVKISQEPTPPTSVVQSPLPSPSPLVSNAPSAPATNLVQASSRVQAGPSSTDNNAKSSVEQTSSPWEPTGTVQSTAATISGAESQSDPQPGPSREGLLSSKPPRKRNLRRVDEIEVFESLPPTPVIQSRENSPMPSKRKREPPRLEEGAFNNAFSDARGRRRVSWEGRRARVSGVEGDSGDGNDADERDGALENEQDNLAFWPPLRRKDKGKGRETDMKPHGEGAAQTKSALEMADKQALDLTKLSTGSALMSRPLAHIHRPVAPKHHPFSQLSQELEASQPSHKPSHREHHPFSQPSQYFDLVTQPQGPGASRLAQAEIAPQAQVKISAARRFGFADTKVRNNRFQQAEAESGQSTLYVFNPTSRQYASPSALSRPILPSSSGSAQQPPTPQKPFYRQSSEDSESAVSRSVRFDRDSIDVKGKGRELPQSTPHPKELRHRRNTLGGHVTGDDFETTRQETTSHLDELRSRRSLPLLPTARTALGSFDDSWIGASSRHRRSHSLINRTRSISLDPEVQLSEADESVVVHIGIETAIQTMSENHGFNPEIVRRVWSKTGSLKETDVTLRKMREAAESAALQYLESLQTAETDIDGTAAKPMRWSVDRNSSEPGSRSNGGQARSRSSHVRKSSILQITPVPDDDQSDLASREYSPPKQSRAGQYARLMREGREDEALAREASRVGGVSPFQTPQKGEDDEDDEDSARYEETEETEQLQGWMEVDRPGASPLPDGTDASQILADALRQKKLQELEDKMGSSSVKILLGKKLGSILFGSSA